MEELEIENRVRAVKAELAYGNAFGERVFLVAATKTQSAEKINAAIRGGVDAVAENRAQEFRDKTGIDACPRHFIGRLQENKLKYIVGKVSLIHSCDSDALAKAIAVRSQTLGITSDVLVQVNVGEEAQKGGYPVAETLSAIERLSRMDGLCVKGLMTVLPATEDASLLRTLATRTRALFETARERFEKVEFLSMGMSGDYRLCVECGSNMVRLGSTIFGKRE